MKEFLFRGKRVADSLWVKGNYISIDEKVYRDLRDYEENTEPDRHYIMFYQMGEGNYPGNQICALVRPETVGQFIGMTDLKGRKIFMGDIVEAWSQGVKARGEIRQREDGTYIMYPAWQNGQQWSLSPTINGKTSVEIIGNVWDQPELLGG